MQSDDQTIEEVDPYLEIWPDDTRTPEGFKSARRELGLSQEDLAYVLGINDKTLRIWERDGDRGPNPAAARALIWFLEGFRPSEWPTDESEEDAD